jgi:DEAD/DEAH box helicase domain-containing protein
VWWSLPAALLEREFASRQAVIDGFLGAAQALHTVATLAVMAEGRDLQKAVGTGEGAIRRRGTPSPFAAPRDNDDDEASGEFAPTVYLYDNYPGGIGLSEPLYLRSTELLQRARELIPACACAEGCPACIGAQAGEPSAEPSKPLALRVIALLERAA